MSRYREASVAAFYLSYIYLYTYLLICDILMVWRCIMNEKTKTLKLNLDDPTEHALWEWLKRLPHGDFSHKTKEYWLEQMKKENGK